MHYGVSMFSLHTVYNYMHASTFLYIDEDTEGDIYWESFQWHIKTEACVLTA